MDWRANVNLWQKFLSGVKIAANCRNTPPSDAAVQHNTCETDFPPPDRTASAAAGLSQADLDALAAGEPPALTTEPERVIYALTRRILAAGAVDDDEYAQAVAVLGAAGLLELTTLLGWYSMLAIQLSVFGLLPPGERGD